MEMNKLEKVVKKLEELSSFLFREYGKAHAEEANLYYDRFLAVEDACAMLKKQETEKLSNWIKCSDRMPEERDTFFAKLKGTDKWNSAMFEKMSEDVRVVVVFEDGARRVHHSYTVDGKWDIEKKPPKRIVTHWMPNPELPDE